MEKFVKTRKRGGTSIRSILSNIGTPLSRYSRRMFPSRRVHQEPPVPIIEEINPDVLAITRQLDTLENNIDKIIKQMSFDKNVIIANNVAINKIFNDIQRMISGAVGTDEKLYKIDQADDLMRKLKNIVDKQSTAMADAANERANRFGGTQKRKYRKHRKPKKSRKHRK
jgi:hypothetical protein